MAKKRMFSMKIVDTDAFLDMPLSTQCLYFHLNMRADDDGFIGNTKRIMRLIGASDDDLKILLAKNFVIAYENGVLVIKHWRMHNTLGKERYHETQYVEEKKMLKIKDNGSYSLTSGKPIDDTKYIEMYKERRTNGEQVETSDLDLDLDLGIDIDIDIDLDKELDIDKTNNTISKDNKSNNNKSIDIVSCTESNPFNNILQRWNDLSAYGIPPIRSITPGTNRHRILKARIRQYSESAVLEAIENIKDSQFLQGHNSRGWMIKFDWFILPNNFIKVLEGNYKDADKKSNNPKNADGSYDWDSL